MKRNGNTNINRTYNPQNTKPPIPLDVDEVDLVLERFIRQKYDQQLFISGSTGPARKNDTGSTRSSEDHPPPLPPKPGKRYGFGLRSVSSTLPSQRNGPTFSSQSPHNSNGWSDEPLRVNKQSRVFGASVGGNNENLDTKLAQLRDMGFLDERRNINVLKGLGGNMEKAIESLVRLGEGSSPSSRARTPLQPRNGAISQSTPSTMPTNSVTDGIYLTNNGSVSQNDTGSTGQQSSQGSAAPPQPATRSFSPANPYLSHGQSFIPIDPPNDQRAMIASLYQPFSGMQISQQPLFPNATGGYPNQPHPALDARFQTMTPPVPQVPHQHPQPNPYMQQIHNMRGSLNPFNQITHQSLPASPNIYAPNIQAQTATSPHIPLQQASTTLSTLMAYPADPSQRSPSQVEQNFFQQAPQHQYLQQQPALLQTQVSQQQQSSPFSSQQYSSSSVQHDIPNQQQAQEPLGPYGPQTLQAQRTGRIDKASILALYNYPQLAPTPIQKDIVNRDSAPSEEQTNRHLLPETAPQRSVTMPVQTPSGSRNPFQSSVNTKSSTNTNPPGFGRHVSQESVDIGGFQNGRHSPDTFASLSARFVR